MFLCIFKLNGFHKNDVKQTTDDVKSCCETGLLIKSISFSCFEQH